MRYVPTVAVLVLFTVSSFPVMFVDGPRIVYIENETRSCKRWWWACLLLVQNYVNVRENVRVFDLSVRW